MQFLIMPRAFIINAAIAVMLILSGTDAKDGLDKTSNSVDTDSPAITWPKDDEENNLPSLETFMKAIQNENEASRRVKRDEEGDTENLLLKIYIMADYSVKQNWMAIEKDASKANDSIHFYYSHLMDKIRTSFRNILEGTNRYELKIVGMYIAQTKEDSYFTEGADVKGSSENSIRYDVALENIIDWVRQNKDKVPNFASLVFFTRYTDENANVTGKAMKGYGCKQEGVVIVRDKGLLTSTGNAAHQIGHSFRADDDGENNQCLASDKYIMNPGGERYLQNLYSNCSINNFENYINSFGSSVKRACLVDAANAYNEDKMNAYLKELPGQRFTPDQQCQIMFGPDSFYCTAGGQGQTKICTEFYCFDTKANKCQLSPDHGSFDGTPCGNMTWCKNGSCVFDQNAPKKPEYCTYGESRETKYTSAGNFSCSEVLLKPSLCYNNDMCCVSCAKVANKSSAKCPYGDQEYFYYNFNKMRCKEISFWSNYCSVQAITQICCQTCRSSLIDIKINL